MISVKNLIEFEGKLYAFEADLQIENLNGKVTGLVDNIGLYEVKKVVEKGE